MSTPNFCYKNRCIAISDEDYTNGNHPDNGRQYNGNRNYPSYALTEQPECELFIAVITVAYYSGACLDFVENPDFRGEYSEEKYNELLLEETKIMNDFLDKLKIVYGYDEYKCVAVFSNGEALYELVN